MNYLLPWSHCLLPSRLACQLFTLWPGEYTEYPFWEPGELAELSKSPDFSPGVVIPRA